MGFAVVPVNVGVGVCVCTEVSFVCVGTGVEVVEVGVVKGVEVTELPLSSLSPPLEGGLTGTTELEAAAAANVKYEKPGVSTS